MSGRRRSSLAKIALEEPTALNRNSRMKQQGGAGSRRSSLIPPNEQGTGGRRSSLIREQNQGRRSALLPPNQSRRKSLMPDQMGQLGRRRSSNASNNPLAYGEICFNIMYVNIKIKV